MLGGKSVDDFQLIGDLQFFKEPEDSLRSGLVEPGFVSLAGEMG